MLDKRLRCAADFVPNGARLADIGSDHAYLPIALCLENKISCALASDINEGPVAAAVANINKNSLSKKITAVKADGLSGAEDFKPDCITLLGMGGELIVSILSAAPWIKKEGIRIILQPMTHAETVAEYLAREGFTVNDEKIICCQDREDRIYRILCAEYTGERREISGIESLIGKANLDRADCDTLLYVKRALRVLRTRIDGKKKAGLDFLEEKALADSLEAFLSEHKDQNR